MVFYYESFENIWGFIVESVQLRFESSICKYVEDVGIGIFDRVFSVVWYRFGKDGIVVKIKDKKVIISSERWYKKSTCLISAYFPSDGLAINVSVKSTQTWCLFVWLIKWWWRGGYCVCYCVITGYQITWLFVVGDSMNGTGCWNGSVHIFVFMRNFWLNECVHACGIWMWLHKWEYIWSLLLQIIHAKIVENNF